MQAYLFDFDGTLVDSAPDLTHALDVALGRAGLPGVGLGAGTQMVGQGANKLIERAAQHATGDLSLTTESPLCRLLLSVFFEQYELMCTETSFLYPGAMATIRTLKSRGKKIGLVTNKPRRFVELMLPAFDLHGMFEVVVCGDDLQTKKPEPEMVYDALRKLSVTPQQACLVGDSRADLGAAQAAGVSSILVNFGYAGDLDINQAGADRVINELSELLLHDG